MEGFTIVDGVVLVIVAVSALLAYSRGFMREALAIGGWILAAIAAFYFAPQVEPLIKEVPILKDLVASSSQLSILAAFAAVFAVALIVLSIFTPLVSSVVQDSAVGPIDRGLGFLFGVARGVLLIAVALLVYQRMDLNLVEVEEARSREVFEAATAELSKRLPTEVPEWARTRIDQLFGTQSAPVAPEAPTTTTPTEG